MSAPLEGSIDTGRESGEARTSGAFGQAPLPPRSRKDRVLDALRAVTRDPNPILLKELRATLRTPTFVRMLSVIAGLVATVVLMGSASVSEGNAAPAEVGRATYHIFFTILWLVLLFTAPAQASAAFTTEKETKTWESLLLSGMSPQRIVLGKFIAIYGSIVLIVIAVAPVIGVAFLFGGVSPVAVLAAFFWLLGTLAVAVAFGLAVSIRVETTRVAGSLVTVIFVPLSFMFGASMIAVGEIASSSAWGTPFDGPFWFGVALAERFDQLDAWLLLIVLPAFVFGSLVWLNLAGAIAGVMAPGVDRSSGLKAWAMTTTLGAVIAVAGLTSLGSDAENAGELAIVATIVVFTFVLLLGALVLSNEPPLPPRLGTPVGSLSRLVWRAIGPGAAPTLRFTVLLMLGGALVTSLGTVLVRYAVFPYSHHQLRADVAIAALAIGGGAVLAAFAAVAAWLRSTLRNGAAARVLTLVIFTGMAFGSLLIVSTVDPSAVNRLDDSIDPIVGLSPMGPILAAVRLMDGPPPDDVEVGIMGVSALVYLLIAFAGWILVEVKRVEVARLAEEHKQRLVDKLGPVASPALRPAKQTSLAPKAKATAPADGPSTADALSSPSTTSEPEREATPPSSEPLSSEPEARASSAPASSVPEAAPPSEPEP